MLLYYLLILVMPLERHPLWASMIGGLTVVKMLGAACLVYALAYCILRSRRPDIVGTWPGRLMLAFVPIPILGYLRTGRLESWELSPAASVISFLMLYFATLVLVDTREKLRRCLLCAIGAVGFASLYVMRDWQKYHDLYSNYRASGAVGDPNYFALTAMFAIPLGVYLAFERNSWTQRIFCLGCAVSTVCGVGLGASRGAILGMSALFLMIAMRSRHRLRYAALAMVLLLPPNLLLTNSPLKRLLVPSDRDVVNVTERTTVWKASLRMVQAHPLIGVGAGMFKTSVVDFEGPVEVPVQSIAHNTLLEIAAEMGLPALALYLAMYVSAFLLLQRVRRRCGGEGLLGRAALAIQAGLMGAGVCGLFVSAEYEKAPWFYLCLAIAVAGLAKHRRRRNRKPAAGEDADSTELVASPMETR